MRTLIGKLGLRADERDLALEPGIPQAGGDRVPGGTAADDYRFLESSRTRNSDQTRYPPSTAIAKAYAVTR